MPVTIPNAFVQQFDTTLRLNAQQTESRFQGCVVDRGTITGESFTSNRLGTIDELEEDNTRHGDTVWSDIDHDTRNCLMKDFFQAFPIDKADLQKMLINPNGDYMQRLITASNLRKDQLIYAAARGNSLKKDGSNVILPASQKIAHGSTGMTKAKIIQTKKMFRQNEADQHNGEELFFAYDSKMLEDILADTTLTSADYMAVKMLQEGDVSGSWMGFKWKPYERFDNDGTTWYSFAWAKSGIHLGTGFEEGDVGPRRDKKNTTQVSMAASYGAIRNDENKIVEIAYQ
jgi:hypothetical protein